MVRDTSASPGSAWVREDTLIVVDLRAPLPRPTCDDRTHKPERRSGAHGTRLGDWARTEQTPCMARSRRLTSNHGLQPAPAERARHRDARENSAGSDPLGVGPEFVRPDAAARSTTVPRPCHLARTTRYPARFPAPVALRSNGLQCSPSFSCGAVAKPRSR